jgi:hypothetical protein
MIPREVDVPNDHVDAESSSPLALNDEVGRRDEHF